MTEITYERTYEKEKVVKQPTFLIIGRLIGRAKNHNDYKAVILLEALADKLSPLKIID